MIVGVSAPALALLKGYGWPGNVRELRNMVERAVLLAEGKRLEVKDFGALKTGHIAADGFELPPGGVNLEELEKELVVQALRRAGGNQTKAAERLGLSRRALIDRMTAYGFPRPRKR